MTFSIKTHGFPMAIHGIFNEKPLEKHQMHLLENNPPINQPLMGPMISARHLSMSLWMLPLMSSMSAMASLIGISWMRPIGEHHQMKLFSMRNHQVLITWTLPIKTHGFPMAIHGIFNEKPLEKHQMHLLENNPPINQPLMGPMISARHLSMSLWMLPMMSPMSAMTSLIGASWMRPIGEHHQMEWFSMRNLQVLHGMCQSNLMDFQWQFIGFSMRNHWKHSKCTY